MLQVKDRIKELTTTSGTGTLTLSGTAEAGFQAFSVLGNGTKTYYTISDVNGTDFEIGLGTYSSNTLTRDTIFESSNSGNAISLSATGSTVFVTYPAEKSSYRDIGVNRDYTASGSITAGKPLILNADNTVTQVAESSTTPISFAVGSVQEIDSSSGNSDYFNIYDSYRNKVLAIYRKGSGSYNLVYRVGTIDTSANTITYSSESNITTGGIHSLFAVYDEVQQATIVFYNDNSAGEGKANVITLDSSGNATVSSAQTFHNDNTGDTSAVYAGSSKTVISFAGDVSGTTLLRSKVISLSGTTLTFGTLVTVSGGYPNNPCIGYDTDQEKAVIVWRDAGNSYYITEELGTISGTDITYTSSVKISASSPFPDNERALTYDKENKKLVLNLYTSSTNQIYVITVSGSSTTWGSAQQYSTTSNDATISYNPTSKNSLLAYRNSTTNYPIARSVTLSGSTVSFGAETQVSTTNVSGNDVATASAGAKSIVSYVDSSNNNYDGAVVTMPVASVTTTNLTNDNYFGIASTTASTTEAVGVNRAGSFNNDQTGMSAGKDMYVTDAGLIKQRTTTTTTTNSDISSSNGDKFADVKNYTGNISVAYDTVNNKIGIIYINNNQYPTIVIAEESNNALTYGTPVVVNSASSTTQHLGQKLTYGNGVFVATYSEGNSPVYVKAGSYSGTNSITLGSAIQPNTGTSHFSGGTIAYNPNANKFVYTFAVNASTDVIAYLITNSGTTLTTGNSATITMGYTGDNKVVTNEYDPDTNKQVIMTDHLYGDEGRIYQATISGANITVPSTHYAITDEGTEEEGSKALSYDPDNNKWILFKANTGNVLRANVLTASGDTFTSGTVTQISSNYFRWLAPYYDTEQNKTILTYRYNSSPYYAGIGFVTISGTTPSFTASSTTLGNTATSGSSLYNQPHQAIYNPDTKSGIVVASFSINSPSDGMGVVLYYGTTTSTVVNGSQFVGTARSGTDLELAEPPTELVSMANGSITKGKPVIVRTDGDFAEVSGTTDSGTEINVLNNTTAMGSGVPASYNSIASASDGNGTTCFVYRRSSDQYGMAQLVTTDSTGATTYGTLFSFFSVQTDCRHMGVSYDANYNDGAGGFYISVQRNALSKTYLVGLLFTGTTITYGDDTNWTTGSSTAEIFYNAYDSTNDKTYVWTSKPYSSMTAVTNHTGDYFQAGSINYPYGSASSRMQFGNMIYDNTNNRGTIFYRDESNSDYPTAMAYTVSGTTFTFGTATVLESSASWYINGAEGEADGNGTICVWNNGSNTALKSTVLSYSGTTITNGAIVSFNSSSVIQAYQHLTYNKKSKQYLAVINSETTSDPKIPQIFVGTYSSGSITWGSKIALASLGSNGNQLNFNGVIINETGNGAQNFIGAYTNWPAIYGGVYASAYSNTITNLTANNFIGFAQDTVADNEDVKVKVISQSDENQTGLTTASQYYVQTDGTLSTTAGTPSVLGGTALSSTKILIKS